MIFGLFMTWGIGANDVANALGTSVGSGAITVGTAIVIAAIFEFLGAAVAGGHVTKTIRKGIIDPSAIVDNPEILVFGMLAALLAAAIWLAFASIKGWPVSTTHSIRWVPAYAFLVGFVMALVTLFKGLKHLKLDLSVPMSLGLALIFGIAVAAIGRYAVRRIKIDKDDPDNKIKYKVHGIA